MSAIKMYTTSRCNDCLIAKSFLLKFQIPFEEINIENDTEATEYVMRLNDGRRSVPTLVYNGEATSLSRFSRAKLDSFLTRHRLLEAGANLGVARGI